MTAEITEIHKGYLRADAVDDPRAVTGPGRAAVPATRIPGGCGGCDLQHVAGDAQLRWKAAVVARTARAAGRAPHFGTGGAAARRPARLAQPGPLRGRRRRPPRPAAAPVAPGGADRPLPDRAPRHPGARPARRSPGRRRTRSRRWRPPAATWPSVAWPADGTARRDGPGRGDRDRGGTALERTRRKASGRCTRPPPTRSPRPSWRCSGPPPARAPGTSTAAPGLFAAAVAGAHRGPHHPGRVVAGRRRRGPRQPRRPAHGRGRRGPGGRRAGPAPDHRPGRPRGARPAAGRSRRPGGPRRSPAPDRAPSPMWPATRPRWPGTWPPSVSWAGSWPGCGPSTASR